MILDAFLILLLIVLLLATVFWTYLLAYLLWYRVPLISTNKKTIEKALELAQIKPHESVVELGCGWAPFLFTAQRQAPNAVYTGYDVLRPVLWLNNWKAKGQINFVRGDFFKADLSKSDVVYCYLWDTVMEQIYAQHWPTFKNGTRLVSYDFPIKNLEPQRTVKLGKSTLYLYKKD